MAVHHRLVRLFSIFTLLCAVSFSPLSFAAKPNLVLLPIEVSEQDVELESEYGSALQEGLQDRYTVYYGSEVEKQLEKEYSKIDCSTESCNQNLAIAFNGELIADASVKQRSGGYLLKVVIRNVLTGEVVFTSTEPCKQCGEFDVISALKTMGRGNSLASSSHSLRVDYSPASTSSANSDERAILIFDSEPSGANITLDGKIIGMTPYQGLDHKIGDKISLSVHHKNYQTALVELQLNQAITQLKPIQLKTAEGAILITSEPFKPNAKVFIDGKEQGLAPLEISLPVGKYDVHIETQHKKTASTPITIAEGSNSPIKLGFGLAAGKKETFHIKGVEFEFIGVPAGHFIMGNDNGSKAEQPAHSVNIASFSMMTTEVTQAQWQAVMGDNPAEFSGGLFSSYDNYPVEQVSWNDIQLFIQKFNQLTGKSVRLPSESEWEYAARAGSTSIYHWGDDINCTQARYRSNECDNRESSGPVKSYQANPFGLYDMHGNVYEWVQDCWNNSYVGAPANGSSWSDGNCDRAVVRGGSWAIYPDALSSSYRGASSRSTRSSYFGFRLAMH